MKGNEDTNFPEKQAPTSKGNFGKGTIFTNT